MPIPSKVMFLEHVVRRVTAKYTTGQGVGVLFTLPENYIKFEFMIWLEASVSTYNMPFQHPPEGTEKEHKNMSRMQVSKERYEFGGPPPLETMTQKCY